MLTLGLERTVRMRRYFPALMSVIAFSINSVIIAGDLVIGLGDALGVEILADLAGDVVGALDLAHNDRQGITVRLGAGQAEFFRRPQAKRVCCGARSP